jgi:hypothetical protein
MPGPQKSAKIVDGVLFPSLAQVEQIAAQIQAKIKSSPAFAKEFTSDPYAILGTMGLNAEVQAELLHDDGVPLPDSCYITTCWFTRCVFTRCFVTIMKINPKIVAGGGQQFGPISPKRQSSPKTTRG